MTKQLLIYETAVPVTVTQHGNTFFDAVDDYGFSSSMNAVPLLAAEIFEAASEYAVVFVEMGKEITPAAILGVKPEQNLYLSNDAHWQAKYIPSFLRRYPFIFSASDDKKTLTLCIDETHPGFNTEGRGERLFNEDGNPSDYSQRVLEFLKAYQAQFEYSQQFSKKLKELNLLEPLQAEVATPTGEKVLLGDFQGVTRDRMHTLSAEALAELAKTDELELIYLHIASLRNFTAVKDRYVKTLAVPASPQ
ncbi:MAG: SapC family protein [Planctomycetes bacterium]|nr:SapC family protein [Planctomycetota bacterium]